jgi:hypothetical protein
MSKIYTTLTMKTESMGGFHANLMIHKHILGERASGHFVRFPTVMRHAALGHLDLYDTSKINVKLFVCS